MYSIIFISLILSILYTIKLIYFLFCIPSLQYLQFFDHSLIVTYPYFSDFLLVARLP